MMRLLFINIGMVCISLGAFSQAIAGADGNVSCIYLPGGIFTWISGIGVFYPDGTKTQRTGIKIDKIVTPTVEGIKAGKMNCLRKQFISSMKKQRGNKRD